MTSCKVKQVNREKYVKPTIIEISLLAQEVVCGGCKVLGNVSPLVLCGAGCSSGGS